MLSQGIYYLAVFCYMNTCVIPAPVVGVFTHPVMCELAAEASEAKYPDTDFICIQQTTL